MIRTAAFYWLIVSLFCFHGRGLGADTNADAALQKLADALVESHCAANPLEAVALGQHQQDGCFIVPDRAALANERERLTELDRKLKAISADRLAPEERRDWRLMRHAIDSQRWHLEQQREPWRNPMFYARLLDASIYLKRDFKPLEERIRDITAVLRYAPANFAAARDNLDATLPRLFVEGAIQVALGMQKFLDNDVAREAQAVSDAATRRDFERAKTIAVGEFAAYANWLKAEKLPHADESFAVGKEAYEQMLQAELVDLSAAEVLALGMRELKAEQQRFAQAAAIIDAKSTPHDVYKTIQREHPAAAELIPEARKHLEVLRQRLIDRRIVTVPSEVRAQVAETLPPFRAMSFASMDTPGPFETKATAAYYYITPVEPTWPPEQAEEWLTAFNNYTTDVVSIHEAYPGHYLQFLALNASSASTVAKVFTSYAFVEGWAHYTEQMMIDEGYGQPTNPATATRAEQLLGAKYRLAQSDEALLRLCRLCCSARMHTQGMSVDEATRFFMENCYYEAKPARQEAIRGTYDPGYLYYTLGKLMILKLRDDWRAQEGSRYSLQRFHDELLRHGAPPIRVLREIMLTDPRQWPKTL